MTTHIYSLSCSVTTQSLHSRPEDPSTSSLAAATHSQTREENPLFPENSTEYSLRLEVDTTPKSFTHGYKLPHCKVDLKA